MPTGENILSLIRYISIWSRQFIIRCKKYTVRFVRHRFSSVQFLYALFCFRILFWCRNHCQCWATYWFSTILAHFPLVQAPPNVSNICHANFFLHRFLLLLLLLFFFHSNYLNCEHIEFIGKFILDLIILFENSFLKRSLHYSRQELFEYSNADWINDTTKLF